jgi:hypothetical protein
MMRASEGDVPRFRLCERKATRLGARGWPWRFRFGAYVARGFAQRNRRFLPGHIQAEQAQFDKLKEGDRVKVRYRLGKYTKTVWAAELVGTKK